MNYKIFFLLAMVSFYSTILSQDFENNQDSNEENFKNNENKFSSQGITVVGNKTEEKNKIPGSAYTLDKEYLEKAVPVDAMEALRRAPGSSVRYQDAAGLTANIGFRGVSNEESRKTLILEDGILTSLSPYGQPESYYIPSMERMERVEVIKGSGAILFGPNTIGGIVNFVTKKPPEKATLNLQTIGGENGYFSQFVSYGDRLDSSAFEVNAIRRQGDGFRDHQNFFANEANMKWIQYWNPNHHTSIRFSYHEHEAESTYLGLSQGLFWKNPKINPAKFDTKELNRLSGVIQHRWKLNNKNKLDFIFYTTKSRRDWARQEFSFDRKRQKIGLQETDFFIPPPIDTLGTFSPGFSGIGNRPGDSLYMREAFVHRDQGFSTFGGETRLESKFKIFGIHNSLNSGIRLHGEDNNIQTSYRGTRDLRGYIERSLVQNQSLSQGLEKYYLSDPKFILNQQDRMIESFSAYTQDQISLTKKWKLTPGVRYEEFIQKVITHRRPTIQEDINLGLVIPGDIATNRKSSSATRNKVILPGLGLSYDIMRKFVWFAGVHKGFSPPTFGTSFSNLGEDFRLDPEMSTNYESGFRGDITDYIYLELVGYKMFFRDQIVNVNEIDESGSSIPANTGFSTHTGGEVVLAVDFGNYFKLPWKLPVEVIYSYIEAKNKSYTFLTSVKDNNGNTIISDDPLFYIRDWQVISKDTNGNYLPYVPKHALTTAIGFTSPGGYYGRLEYQYIDKQFSDLENTRKETPDGSLGVLPKIELWNLSMGYKSFSNWRIFINIKNLQNKIYVSGRLPIGIHPGPFRQINMGLALEL